jgi:hypothetical protein
MRRGQTSKPGCQNRDALRRHKDYSAQRLRPDREVQNGRGLSVCEEGAKDSRFPESRSYVFCVADLYQRARTHLSLGKDSPEPRLIEPREMGRVVALPQVGGLHHRYQRSAA